MRGWALLAGVAGGIVALDQWTKHWAATALPFQRPVEIIGEYVRLTYTRNSGIAFGLGSGSGFPYFVFSIAAAIAILWLYWRRRPERVAPRIALALILGGALGNLVDRLTTGSVVDFIEVGAGGWHWPVFNVADSAVSVGVVLFAMVWPRRKLADEQETAEPSASGSVMTLEAEAAPDGTDDDGTSVRAIGLRNPEG